MEWTQNLSVGVEAIDNQHKMWFEKANALFEACSKGKGRAYISELLDFLQDYTKIHFRDEEKYMQSLKYPGYQAQKALHIDFISQLDKLKKEFSASGGNLTLVIDANKLLLNWFSNHISTVDKKLGEYAKTAEK